MCLFQREAQFYTEVVPLWQKKILEIGNSDDKLPFAKCIWAQNGAIVMEDLQQEGK